MALHFKTAAGATVVDEAERVVEAVITTSRRDSDGDVIDTKGIDIADFQKNPVVLFGHDAGRFPVGKVLSLDIRDGDIRAKIKFADTDDGRELFKLYKDGVMRGWSIGFVPVEWRELKDGGGKYFSRITLKELSAVCIPANPEALSKMIGGIASKAVRKVAEKAICPESLLVADGNPCGKTFDGVAIAPGAFSRTVRNNGFPLPPGYALRIQPVDKKWDADGKLTITEARIMGMEQKAMEGPDPSGPALKFGLRKYGGMWQLIQEMTYDDGDKSYSSFFISADEIETMFQAYMAEMAADAEADPDAGKGAAGLEVKSGRKLAERRRALMRDIYKLVKQAAKMLDDLHDDTAPPEPSEKAVGSEAKPIQKSEPKAAATAGDLALRFKALAMLHPDYFTSNSCDQKGGGSHERDGRIDGKDAGTERQGRDD